MSTRQAMLLPSFHGDDVLYREAALTRDEVEDALTGRAGERPAPEVFLRLAQASEGLGRRGDAARWALAVVDAGDDFATWQAAAGVLRRCESGALSPLRSARLAVLGSANTSQLVPLIGLATRQRGVALELYESEYDQYRREILDGESGFYRFEPDFVLLAVHEGDLALPGHSGNPSDDVAVEVERWTSLWRLVGARTGATIIQPTFALPLENAMGHLAAQLSGSRYQMTQALNARLGDEAARAEQPVLILDCERLSALIGKERWVDPRYWHLARNAVAPPAMPLLARHCAALVGATLGLSKKCVVLDLDNTLWGGIVGEDGLAGIQLGGGVEGQAYVAFQEYLLELRARGVLLAVCSKNNEADAMEPFERHPDMRLSLGDFAAFVADWRPKSEQIQSVAERLGIGLDALVFVDDDPVERDEVRRRVPKVDVLALPDDASYYVRALDEYLPLQAAAFTDEDAHRAEHYGARAEVAQLAAAAPSIEDFLRSLNMQARITYFDDIDLPRIAQLLGKTNQFNVAGRRHHVPALRGFATDSTVIDLSLRLRDRFTDYGLVAVVIALDDGETLEIDTWVMSCRVLGRTVETALLHRLCREAQARGRRRITVTYVPTEKNGLTIDVFERLGFAIHEEAGAASIWTYDVDDLAQTSSEFIDTETWSRPN